MTRSRPPQILCQSVDCFGQIWNVTESRPTEHDWDLLVGYPAFNSDPTKRITGPARTILTPALRAYLEEFRMKRGMVRLPLGSTTICKLRRQLGMNYWRDCKTWWKETKDTNKSGPSALGSDAPLKPKNLTWTRNEIRQVRKLLKDGLSIPEIAKMLGKKEKTVFKLRQRLFGPKIRFWTPQEEEKLFEAVYENLPLATIAGRLNRSLPSIKGKLVMLRKKERDSAPRVNVCQHS